MHVIAVPCLKDNLAYLLVHGGRAVVVDPGEAAPVRGALARADVELVAIWCTHHHADHVAGIPELRAAFPKAKLVASAHDLAAGRIPGARVGDRAVEEGTTWSPFEDVEIGAEGGPPEAARAGASGPRARTLAVPGHTLGAVAYVIDGHAFTGDTLFNAGCGRLFEGTPVQMRASLARLRALPPTTRIWSGHAYTASNLAWARSLLPEDPALARRAAEIAEEAAQGGPTTGATLAEERATNLFLRWDAPEVRDLANALLPALPPRAWPEELADRTFAVLRAHKDG